MASTGGVLLKAAHHSARLLTLATGVFLCVVLLVPSLTGDPSLTIASLHPFLMTAAFVIFMSVGVTAYVSDFGGRVRAGGRRRGEGYFLGRARRPTSAPPRARRSQINRAFPSRASRRLLHGMMMFSATLLALIGFLIRFVATQRSAGSTHLPQPSDPMWLKIHVYVGYAVLLGAGLMTFVGASHRDPARAAERRRRRRGSDHPPPPPQASTSSSCALARTWR